MKLSKILLGAAALVVLSAGSAFAAEFLGGQVKTMDIGGQEVLVGSNDMTLYTFDKDTQGSASNCYDQCAVNWPPLLVPADTAVEGDFTLMDRTDTDQKIVAYKGWPLYFWVKDEKPGDTTGDMVGEVWHTAVYEGM
jgi:predicted lipoprotein with Yx(FWY)xxD motif